MPSAEPVPYSGFRIPCRCRLRASRGRVLGAPRQRRVARLRPASAAVSPRRRHEGAGHRASRHNNGAFGKKYLPETLGSGAAFLDYDNDGRQDILLVNGTAWPGQKPPRAIARRGSIATTATAASPT